MFVRNIAVSGALALMVALAGCGDRDNGGKTDESSAERVSEALDICAEGRGAFANAVCDNNTLVGLDNEVRETLVAESASVSDAGAAMLVQNQTRWREAARIACGIIDPESALTPEQTSCLESEFRARIEEAAGAVEQAGGYVFQRMEVVDATPVTAEAAEAVGLTGDDVPTAITRDIRFPRIDGPQTPQIQRFNELVAQSPQFALGDATNESLDYRIAFAGPELISVRFDSSSDTLGAAHGNTTSRAVNVLMREGRPLAEADVFRADAAWQDYLTQRAVAEITRQFREDGFVPPERDVRESATKPHLWLITEDGLVLLFPPYSFGAPYVMGGTEVTIPWRDLRPYLNPAAPAPVRAPA
ncbi:MAG: DUF3298 domain-containing protein [Hyphomonadaceae bacterium]|nr:DUF3298 domain-containing protein [Hyphomonadaceae bacterium]